jgi:hypothetical protein
MNSENRMKGKTGVYQALDLAYATWLSSPCGMITSAYFFEGRIKSSNAGFTNLPYYTCKMNFILLICINA